MTGSMYAAISGLKAHMGALNVIGNNVANVNTLAYKTTRYTFNEALYTTQISGSDGNEAAGGRNPAQIGFGANVGTIDLDMSTKNYTPTGLQLDTMIDGDGFFMLGDKTTEQGIAGINILDKGALSGLKLSRLGNFSIDPKGYLVDGNGNVVWGFLEVDAGTNVFTAVNHVNGLNDDGTAFNLASLTEEEKKLASTANNIRYNENGTVKSATHTSTILTAIRLPQNDDDRKLYFPREATINGTLPSTENAQAGEQNEENDRAQVVDRSDLQVSTEDGNGGETQTISGTRGRSQGDTYSIDPKTGALTMLYNDELVTVGNIAIAKVTNPNGVTHVDGRYYQAQKGAGEMRVTSLKYIGDEVDRAGDTQFITGGLESSGTDLATEITNMITVQRGYQANTRIITVTDSMLEELVNMKR